MLFRSHHHPFQIIRLMFVLSLQIRGSPKNAAAAKEALLAIREEREIEKLNKEMKSFKITIQVDPEYHPKIIGT